MFIDSRSVEEGAVIETTVCIIGAGVAGITMALELEKPGISAVLLESGGYKADDDTRDLYRGENVGVPYEFADGCRSRFLGGSSNCWGGWCRPLDPWDFEKRDWVADRGWPFGLEELRPYYARTHQLLQLGENNFEPAYWEAAIHRNDVRRHPFPTGKVRDTISQFSPPVRFGKVYRKHLLDAKNVRVFLFANALNIDTDSEARTVTKIEIGTFTGRRFAVRAKHFRAGDGRDRKCAAVAVVEQGAEGGAGQRQRSRRPLLHGPSAHHVGEGELQEGMGAQQALRHQVSLSEPRGVGVWHVHFVAVCADAIGARKREAAQCARGSTRCSAAKTRRAPKR